MSDAVDRARVRRSARRVGLLVGVAAAVVIAVGALLLVAVILVSAALGREESRPGHVDRDRVVVDVGSILPWIAVLGVLGVALLTLIAWWAARRSVRPLVAALRAQRNFVSDASHELRTPLTALSGRIQILQRRRERGEPIDEVVVQLREDAGLLDEVLTDMLLAAEGADTTGERASTAGCARSAARVVAARAEETGVTVDVRIAQDVVVRMPAATTTRLCLALLDNAVGHAPAGSRVVLDVRRGAGVAEIRVRDRGPGIAPGDLDRIFERFARGAESGRRRGFGLGLALVREAASRYGGAVRIEETSPEGTTFLLTIPAA